MIHIRSNLVTSDFVNDLSTAVVSTFPHPSLPSTVLLLSSNEGAGLERAYRQFPLRTGVTTPDWLVMSEGVDNLGAAGLDGAGYVHFTSLVIRMTNAKQKTAHGGLNGFGTNPCRG